MLGRVWLPVVLVAGGVACAGQGSKGTVPRPDQRDLANCYRYAFDSAVPPHLATIERHLRLTNTSAKLPYAWALGAFPAPGEKVSDFNLSHWVQFGDTVQVVWGNGFDRIRLVFGQIADGNPVKGTLTLVSDQSLPPEIWTVTIERTNCNGGPDDGRPLSVIRIQQISPYAYVDVSIRYVQPSERLRTARDSAAKFKDIVGKEVKTVLRRLAGQDPPTALTSNRPVFAWVSIRSSHVSILSTPRDPS